MPMFVRKTFGFGISPGDWRGWLLTIVYCLAMLVTSLFHSLGGAIAAAILTGVYFAFSYWAFKRQI